MKWRQEREKGYLPILPTLPLFGFQLCTLTPSPVPYSASLLKGDGRDFGVSEFRGCCPSPESLGGVISWGQKPGGSLGLWDLPLCSLLPPSSHPVAFLTLHNEVVDLFHFILIFPLYPPWLGNHKSTASSLAFLMYIPLKLKTQEEEAPQTLKCSACLLALASGLTGSTCSPGRVGS